MKLTFLNFANLKALMWDLFNFIISIWKKVKIFQNNDLVKCKEIFIMTILVLFYFSPLKLRQISTHCLPPLMSGQVGAPSCWAHILISCLLLLYYYISLFIHFPFFLRLRWTWAKTFRTFFSCLLILSSWFFVFLYKSI